MPQQSKVDPVIQRMIDDGLDVSPIQGHQAAPAPTPPPGQVSGAPPPLTPPGMGVMDFIKSSFPSLVGGNKSPEEMTAGELAMHNISQIPSAIVNFPGDVASGLTDLASHALTGNYMGAAHDIWGALQPERTIARGTAALINQRANPNLRPSDFPYVNQPSSKDWENAVYGATQQAAPLVAGGIGKAVAAAPGMAGDFVAGRIGKAIGKVMDASKTAEAPQPPPSSPPSPSTPNAFTHVTVRDATTGKFRSLTPAEEDRFGIGKNAAPAAPKPPFIRVTKGSVAASIPAAGTKKQEP